ncbi:MAG: LCP family protein [Candidatus Caenarcaniphilales bacterium]|nr:LCP family protein [Candidatus Caenarcaniphilales bacterium]
MTDSKRNSSNTNRSLALELIVFFLVVFLIFGLTYLNKTSIHGQKDNFNFINTFSFYSLKEPVTLLVAGTDQEYKIAKDGYAYKTQNKFKGRTDTIVVFKFDPIQKRLSALNIPRDTKIYLNGKTADKINSVNVIKGPEYLKQVVESLLDIKIDHYVLVNTKGIEQIIDEAGGVEVEVDKRMKYVDKTDGLNIDLQPGKQVLSGKQTIGFLRFRHDNLGDIGRIQRQQIFLRAAKKKLSDPYMVTKLPKLTNIALENIKTDLKISELLQFANFVRSVLSDDHVFATLPGDFSMPEMQTKGVYEEVYPVAPDQGQDSSSAQPSPGTSSTGTAGDLGGDTLEGSGEPILREKVITVQAPFVSYWIANEAEIKKVVAKLFKYDETLSEEETIDPHSIKVAIENISGDRNASAKLSSQLRKAGFSIVDISNSKKVLPSSIYAQKGNLEDAKLIHKKLGLSSSVQVIGSSMGFPLADITIILGEELRAEINGEEPKLKAKAKTKN